MTFKTPSLNVTSQIYKIIREELQNQNDHLQQA